MVLINIKYNWGIWLKVLKTIAQRFGRDTKMIGEGFGTTD